MDPAVRLKVFQKWDACIVPIDYVQPSLKADLPKCATLKLLAYSHPETGEYPTPQAIKNFIHGIYTELAKYNGSDPLADPDYLKITQRLDALDQKKPITPKTSL